MLTAYLIFIVIPLAILGGIIVWELTRAVPDPDDERISAERLAVLRDEARREGRYW